MSWIIYSIESLEEKCQPPEALADIKMQRDWLRKHGFDYSFVEWPDGLLALIVHPRDEAPKADQVRVAWERAQQANASEVANGH